MRATAILARVLVVTSVVGIAAEILLRTLLRASIVPTSYQDPEDLMLRFDARTLTSGSLTSGPLTRNRIRWHINNEGWNCSYDYEPRRSDRPRVALLGDSFIEGLRVDVDDHLEQRLTRLFRDEVDVYAFGRSNWYLEQYVAASRYVEARFSPDIYVIFLHIYDVWWSLREKRMTSTHLFQIRRQGETFEELKPTETVNNRPLRLHRRSAVYRYQRNNLPLRRAIRRLRGRGFATTRDKIDDGDIRPEQPQGEDAVLLQEAVRFMLDSLVRDLPKKKLVFVDNSDLKSVYRGRPEPRRSPEVETVRRESWEHEECYFLDLWPVWVTDYQQNQKKFEATDGSHWSSYANGVIAKGIYDFLLDNALISWPNATIAAARGGVFEREGPRRLTPA